MNTRWLDDLAPGMRITTGGLTFTEAGIVDFAYQHDPQPFHIDAVAAAASPYGGLIASGFQTLAVTFRLVLQTGVFGKSSIGSPGADQLRWLQPVRPGDTIHAVAEVLEVRPSSSKPDRGVARLRYDAVNQRGETVLRCEMLHLLLRRPAGEADAGRGP